MSAVTSRRVTVEVVVKAATSREAEQIVNRRMTEWFLDPAERELEADFGYPVGALLHFTVRPVTGHRAVAV